MVLSKDIKFSICFGLIIGALFSFCSLCFASENVDVSTAPYLSFSKSSPTIVESTSASGIGYFELEPRV